MNSWVIKAKPSRNDLQKLVLASTESTWYASRIPKNFNKPDILFVWAASPVLRIIGEAVVTQPFAGANGTHLLFGVRYTTNRFAGPTLDSLRNDIILQSASFLKSGPAGTIFPLTGEQGTRLAQLCAASYDEWIDRTARSGLQAETPQNDRADGSGPLYGNAESNRRVEAAAMKASIAHYRHSGYAVEPVPEQKRGYDLVCKKVRQTLHVEVKGIQGNRFEFVITRGEYEKALHDRRFELCLVRNALARPLISTYAAGDMLSQFGFVPLAYKVRMIKSPQLTI